MPAKPGEPLAFALTVAGRDNGETCVAWPYARNSAGYGVVTRDGKKELAHRVICEAANGLTPFAGAVVRHTCGHGGDGCCNPRHLQWGTVADNKADEIGHGTHNRGERHCRSRLSSGDVIAIRDMAKSLSHQQIASLYGIARPTVSSIVQRRNWAWLP